MDFVVAGFGLGAVLMLVGFAVRDLGPFRHRGSEEEDPVSRPWSELCRTVGTTLVTGGLGICLLTLLLLVVGAGDQTGARLIVAGAAIALIGCGVWSALAVRRYTGAIAALPPEVAIGRARRPVRTARRSFRPADPDWTAAETEPEPVDEAPIPFAEIESSWPANVEEKQPTVAAEAERDSDLEPEQAPSTEPVPAPAPPPAPMAPVAQGGMFRSPLLADVETNSSSSNGSGFQSSLLADVAAGDDAEANKRGFASTILADLGGEGEDEGTRDAVAGQAPPSLSEDVASAHAEAMEPPDGSSSGDSVRADQKGVEPSTEAGEVAVAEGVEAKAVPAATPTSRE